jgi:putative sigma-54 modulation protein
MEVEYTGRQAAVTDELRDVAQPILERIEKLAGKASSAHIVLTTEKYRHTAEVTIKTSLQDLVGLCESTSMESALRQALEKAEAQAIRSKEKLKARKRLPTGDKVSVQPGLERASHAGRLSPQPAPDTLVYGTGNGTGNGNGNGVAAHTVPTRTAQKPLGKRPVVAANGEPHVVRSIDAIALRPMSLEEAVKEAEFRDREVFVFRDGGGQVKVLHRKRDGLMELIELPDAQAV